MSERVPFWSDEDSGAFVEVADYPDEAIAGQSIANELRMIVGGNGRGVISTQDCECYPVVDSCPDDPDGAPCRVRVGVVVWCFETFEADDNGAEDAVEFCKRIWLPLGYTGHVPDVDGVTVAPIPVAPGQVEAGL